MVTEKKKEIFPKQENIAKKKRGGEQSLVYPREGEKRDIGREKKKGERKWVVPKRQKKQLSPYTPGKKEMGNVSYGEGKKKGWSFSLPQAPFETSEEGKRGGINNHLKQKKKNREVFSSLIFSPRERDYPLLDGNSQSQKEGSSREILPWGRGGGEPLSLFPCKQEGTS